MKKRLILNKRIPRELTHNKLRYGSLFLLIVLSMSVIISIVSSAESINSTCHENHIRTNLEDGEFYTFVPLTDKNISDISDMDILVEENFYISYDLEDTSSLRVFKNREYINLIELKQGRLANETNEIVLEYNYAISHNYSLNDTITLGSFTYIITGIGYIPDYNLVKKNISDLGADASKFGLAFVTPIAYKNMVLDELIFSAEEYCYTYILNGSSTPNDLKNYLTEMEFDISVVSSTYMKEIISNNENIRNDLKNGVEQLVAGGNDISDAVNRFSNGATDLVNATEILKDASNKFFKGIKSLNEGVSELYNNSDELITGADSIFNTLLMITSSQLQDKGFSIELTQTNYQSELNNIFSQNKNELYDRTRSQISALKDSLNTYAIFYDGIKAYTEAISQSYDGSKSLSLGIDKINNGFGTLNSSTKNLANNNESLNLASDTIFQSLLSNTQSGLRSNGYDISLTADNYSQILYEIYDQIFLIAPDEANELLDTKNQLDIYKSFGSGLNTYTDSVKLIYEECNLLLTGTNTLRDGVNSLSDGLSQLASSGPNVVSGAEQVFDSLLSISSSQLKEYGMDTTLTRADYQEKLSEIYNDSHKIIDENIKSNIGEIIHNLNMVEKFYDGLASYTDGVKKIYDGTKELFDNSDELLNGIQEMRTASDETYIKSQDLLEGVSSLNNGISDLYKNVDNLINEFFDYGYQNLTEFYTNKENSRIWDYKDDSEINKISALFAGIIVLIMIAFIISIFIIHNIDNESKTIGALYSLGYNKKELLLHFIRLPLLITLIGGTLGTIIGFALAGVQTEASSNYYSYGKVEYVYPVYLIIYGIVTPVVVTLLINILVIYKRLSLSPLQLLRKERKEVNLSNIDLRNINFVNRFQIRQFLREFRGYITLSFGMFISVLLIVFAFTIYTSIDNMTVHTTDDIKYKYMYNLKFPPDEVPTNAESSYSESLYTYFDLLGSDLEINIQGIHKDSEYFDFNVSATEKNEVYISTSAQIKFNWDIGDIIVLESKVDNLNYAFRVKGVVQYSNGLYVFMDIDAMRELFNQKDIFYNTLFSKEELSIENGRIYNVITYEDIKEVSAIFMNLMRDMIIMIMVMSMCLFVIVMYILLKLIIDKASMSISLVKIFGYNDREIRKLYLDANLFIVVITCIVGIPIARIIINAVYPSMVSNVAAGMDLSWPIEMYFILVVMILVTYFIVIIFLNKYLKKVSLAEIIKARE